jgi:hypothetical protein
VLPLHLLARPRGIVMPGSLRCEGASFGLWGAWCGCGACHAGTLGAHVCHDAVLGYREAVRLQLCGVFVADVCAVRW